MGHGVDEGSQQESRFWKPVCTDSWSKCRTMCLAKGSDLVSKSKGHFLQCVRHHDKKHVGPKDEIAASSMSTLIEELSLDGEAEDTICWMFEFHCTSLGAERT